MNIKVIKIPKKAIEELLLESLMENGRSWFGIPKHADVLFYMVWNYESDDLIYAVSRRKVKVDLEKLASVVPVTSDSLFTKKPYIVIDLESGEKMCDFFSVSLRKKAGKVIRIQRSAIEEFLHENLLRNGYEYFHLSKHRKALLQMKLSKESDNLIYVASKKNAVVDWDILENEVPITADSLFCRKPYVTLAK